jgi:predicted Rossmann fold nucleotide-binding protein DprA/Smf involved in DNA uptake
MSDAAVESESRKEALKKLKAARKDQIAAATARMKEQRQAVKAIKKHLAEAELTVPEIAAATGLPPSEVLWYVATLKKYGEILEGPKAGGYYRYRLNEAAAPEAEAGPGESRPPFPED